MNKTTTLKTKRLKGRVAAVSLALAMMGGITLAAAPAQAATVGVCTIKANDPHGSTHVAGTINAVGTVDCTVSMNEIYVKTTLEKAGGASWAGAPYDRFNTTRGQSNAATNCSAGPGTFRTVTSYVLRFPPNLNPAYASNTIYGPWRSVACGNARLAPSELVTSPSNVDPGPTTITFAID